MKFSLVVPCFNAEKYLRECLDSIEAQTFAAWECICIDDGSTDSTPEILDEYAKADSRFIVRRTPNGGVSAARNFGISIASGDYVGFVDADDAISREWLESAAAAAGGHADLVRLDPWNRRCGPCVTAAEILVCGFSMLVFVRRGLLAALPECFPAGMRLREDTIFLLRVLGAASSTHQVHAAGYFHRTNTASAVYAVQAVADFTRFVDEIIALAGECDARDVSRAIYKSFLWWRTQRDRREKNADAIASMSLAKARRAGVFMYSTSPLLWLRGFFLADLYISLRRLVNPKWLP